MGTYEVHPAFLATVAASGSRLTVNLPYSPAIDLVAENDSECVVTNHVASAEFTRKRQGNVYGKLVNDERQEMAAKRLR